MTESLQDTEEHGQDFCRHLVQVQTVERSRKLASSTELPLKRSTVCT